MRELIDLIESTQASDYQYVGNCTMQTCAPFLEDMMDQAKEVSYRVLMRAVGRNLLADTFPSFDWSSRPRDLTMVNDYAVSYYRSLYNGMPCYYVRESGIEYIFVRQSDLDAKENSPVEKKSPVRRGSTSISIGPDGSIMSAPYGAIFHVRLEGVRAWVSQSSAATPEALATLRQQLEGITTVIENDDEDEAMSVEEFFASY